MPVKAFHVLKEILLKGPFFLCLELWEVHLILQDEKKSEKLIGKLEN